MTRLLRLVLLAATAGSSFSITWESRPAAPVPRQEVAYVEAGGKLYLAGGLEPLGLEFFSNRHERFDPLTGTWEQLAPLPLPAHHLSGVAFGGRVYYFGGLVGYPFVATGAVMIYDPATDRFTSGAPMPLGRARGAAGVAVYDDRVYVAGGQPGAQVASSQFDVYDPIADTWTSLPDMPRAREHNGAAVVGDRLYVVAGRDGGRVIETDAFDFTTGQWISGLAPIPTARGGIATAALHGEIVVIGGENPNPGEIVPARAEVEAYDPETDAWRSLAPMPVGRHGIQAAVLDGALWVAGGDTSLVTPVTDHDVATPVFAPATISGLRITPARFRPARRGPMITAGRGRARLRFTADRATSVAVTVTGPRRGTVRRDVPAGTTTLRLTGRLRGRPLRPGRYRLTVRPRDGVPVGVSFRIRRGR